MQQRNVNRANKSVNITIPAPMGGLNARDSLDTMSPQDAIVMDNYYPGDTKVTLRPGFSMHCELNAAVHTLFEYKGENKNNLFAIAEDSCYDVSSYEAIKFDDVTFNSDVCQTFQYKDRLFIMNGADTPKVLYQGSPNFVLEDWAFSATNLTDSTIVSGAVSKSRVWFIQKGSLKVWYSSNAGDITGTLKSFDFSQIARFGGSLVAIANWTQDGGQGIDDLTVFLTSEGEALIYSGYDPDNASNWVLRGSYKISKPIGYNCILPYQGDVIIITEDGYLPLSRALPLGQANTSQVAFSDKIRNLVLEKTKYGKSKSGWQGIIYSRGGYAIFNVPYNTSYEQHVVNLNTGAWCRFTGIDSRCWSLHNDYIYFGGRNGVYHYDDGYSDDTLQIAGHIEQAYTDFGSPNLKRVQMINPRTKAFTAYGLTIYLNMDYNERNLDYVTDISGNEKRTKWNEVKWSSLAHPSGTKWACLRGTPRSQWVAISATGFKASIVFKTKTRGNQIEWYDTGLRYQNGSGII